MRTISLLLILSLLAGCSTSRVTSAKPQVSADSLTDSVLAYAFDHEALYTLADTLKPISSVKLLRYTVAKDSTMRDGNDAVVLSKADLLNKIDEYQEVCRRLSRDDWQFVLVPYKRTDKGYRNMEIYVIRKSRFASLMRQHQAFLGQWGFTEHTDPATVIPVIEYESKYDRFRGYGYLFGYPKYAVDFFVHAAEAEDLDSSHKLVPRNFFAIPVHASETGYFTYAVPKDYTPGQADSAIYYKGAQTLERYRELRSKYETNRGLEALKLWKKINQSVGR